MKKTHETQSMENRVNIDECKVYSPIKDLQKIEGIGPLNRKHLDLRIFPKGIRIIGYFIITFLVISALFILIANFILN